MRHTAIKTTPMRQRLLDCTRAAVFACFATLLSLPASAGIMLPNDPLTSASRVPPNVLFILDDSGSMAWRYMYNESISSISGGGINSAATGDNRTGDSSYDTTSTNINAMYDQSSTTNGIYYDSATVYKPWTAADGNAVTGGTSYTAAYSSNNYASGSTGTGSVINLSSDTQTFYTPKLDATNLADATQYYRFQILTNQRIVRSERLQGATNTNDALLQAGLSATRNSYTSTYFLDVPSGATNATFTTQGSNGNADLYVRLTNTPVNTSDWDWRSKGSNSNETISISNPVAGRYYVVVYARNASTGAFTNLTLRGSYTADNNGVASVGCDTNTTGWGWRNCTYTAPTNPGPVTRNEAGELVNFATWYSYYRTRTKTAKAGASDAFSGLGSNIRVGYRTIWNRNNFDIPVTDGNNGVFEDVPAKGVTTRSTWYQRLFDAGATNGTPLRGALNAAGSYFSSSASTGPYGPQSGVDQYACRQNFAILTTDGYWNSDDGFSSGGNQDGSSGVSISNPGNTTTYQYLASAPYSDTVSNTLADVAMYYWKTDLRSDLDNIVPSSVPADPAFWQHMVTFGISIGLKGSTGMTSVGSVPSNYSAWPNPTTTENSTRIDDLLHAAVNGHGTFLAASNSKQFAEGLQAALNTISDRTASFSNVSTNSTQLGTETNVFKASYKSGAWAGELDAYPLVLDPDPTKPPKTMMVSDTASWKASAGIPAFGVRKVYTYDGSSGAAFPTTSQLALLNRVTAPGVTGLNNANYIKGERRLEKQFPSGTLRNRTHLLGDIVSSSPAYAEDTKTVYVGANDGMLHAIDASKDGNGKELFAYIPGGIDIADLGNLSKPDYAHRFFVDGPVVVSSREQTPNKNILVGGLGKGGKGIYALDVTSPDSFVAANVKWEKTSGLNMGLVQGAPIIAKLNNDVTAVIVSNGINSTNNKAVLFVYNLDTGALLAELDTGAGSALAPNGLSAPDGLDVDSDGKLDYVYAGDMLGNVWKFDLSSASPISWSAGGTALFTASKPGFPTAVPQPITAGVTLARDPDTFKLWVFFGTGRFMTSGDVSNSAVQSLYGVIDDESGTKVQIDDLQLRKLAVADSTVASSTKKRGFEPHDTLDMAKKGWYVDLLDPPYPTGSAAGERIVSDVQVIGTVLLVSSIIPEPKDCEPDGRGYLNALDAFTGTSVTQGYFDINRDGKFDETVGTGTAEVPVGSIDLGVGMPTQALILRGLLVVGGSTGGQGALGIRQRTAARVSWREIVKD